MANLLIIGAGGVGRVSAFKAAKNKNTFKNIVLASRTKSKCDAISKDIKEKLGIEIKTYALDANKKENVVDLIKKENIDIVCHVALPYQNLPIMHACIETGAAYLDTALAETEDNPDTYYDLQWALDEDFKKARTMALLGCGFDPGVTSIMVKYAADYLLDELKEIEIYDCNFGSHGRAFATNFDPEINLRELNLPGKYWENGKWHTTKPFEIQTKHNYPECGEATSILIWHEELESIVKHFPNLKSAKFYMCFSNRYLYHFNALKNIGMFSIEPIEICEGCSISPLQFLAKVLPDPQELVTNYKGKTNIGVIVRGKKDGTNKEYYIYNICDHEKAIEETGAHCVSYTTGVPAIIGCKLMAKKIWWEEGVKNVEEFDALAFFEEMEREGLPIKIKEMK
ncbi:MULTISPECIES: saccharopine dehydrogenase family protein [unclassified Lebetimonas]|uniref:saccharopine dehydrogenase family protein n=1 Tax=unclassified Lebetimonas TaxID=2648158 RepID=UPI000463CB44|nr:MULTISPECIES: saccharopine dehydrogenase family protein [unclassified Lebetimonas]